jgi:NAD+ kinase
MKALKGKVLVCSRRDTAAAKQAAERLTDWLQKKGYPVLDVTHSDARISASEAKGVVLGVVIGGDGTFLTLVRRLEQKDQFPIMGVNLGSLGFITEVGKEEMLPAVESVLSGKFHEEGRPLLLVELWREEKNIETWMVFNDAVITKEPKATMLKFDVSIGGELMSYVRADGYIISSPTGSTGYALSAGGPLIHPEVGALLCLPLCSHSLSARPIIIPQKSAVEIHLKECRGQSYLVFDGQVDFELKPLDRVKITTSDTKLRLVQPSGQRWFETLRSKLQMS